MAARLALLVLLWLLSACATPPPTHPADSAKVASWHGRLALRVEADAATGQVQSMTAGFELTGNLSQGVLTLYTPLGTSAVRLDWTKDGATLRRDGETRSFESLSELIRFTLGTNLPVAALFAWLAGDNQAVDGWRADLSRHADGHIVARRTLPAPAAEIRLVLER